jgi:hypothetical protein
MVHSVIWVLNSYSAAQEIPRCNETPEHPLPSENWGFHGGEDVDHIRKGLHPDAAESSPLSHIIYQI